MIEKKMKQKSQYIGILLGVVYGLFIRLLGGHESFEDFYNIYSISFLWVTPIIIGVLPILFSFNQIYQSKIKLFFYPIITVLLFLITALITGIEDFACILIISKKQDKKQKNVFHYFDSVVIKSN
jgi:DMSO reductase anchor subunit